MQEIQKRVAEVFDRAFGRTPLRGRLEDIAKEVDELTRYYDLKNLKEEAGDALASLIQLCTECGWDFDKLVNNTLKKIKSSSRMTTYRALGRKKYVAVMGGAFDPIHEGHIKVAKFVLDTSRAFDEVWLMPCWKHMYNKGMASFKHRMNMCQLAAQCDGRIHVSDYEGRNKFAGETCHLVKRLLGEPWAQDEYDFSMVIGMDNANTFDKWVNYEDLERMIRFVVVPRCGEEPDKKVRWYLQRPHIYLCQDNADLVSISSTILREAIEELYTEDITRRPDYMDPKVWEYIRAHGLYRRVEETPAKAGKGGRKR